jgi:putative acetyltransferase
MDRGMESVCITAMTLRKPTSPEMWAAARRLVEEYATSLNFDLGFQDFTHEIESLAVEYGPPNGCFLLAESDGAFVGCGGLRRFSEIECEMKRLYVTPAHRTGGIGRVLAEGLISEARDIGYKTMLLDTLPSMKRALNLYLSLGFTPTTAYRYNPLPGATFFQLQLQ